MSSEQGHAVRLPVRKAPVVINGKFLSAAPTGVHRVAAELTCAMDRVLKQRREDRSWRLLAPRDARRTLDLDVIRQRRAGVTTWQPWEQIDLPVMASRSVLLNLCNLGPLAHANSIVMMHDAQVFATPESYSAKFRLWYRTVQPLLGRRARRILTVSEFSARELVRFGVAPEDKVRVVPNGCDHFTALRVDSYIVPRLRLSGRAYVLALANTQAHKNVGLLLRAFAHESLRDVTLVLVGKASAADFESLGHIVPANATFTGTVSDEELKGLYLDALCLAFPSTTEGFGLPPMEAMSVGCPVIAAPCGALPEVCGGAALYAASDDPAAWAAAIVGLLSNQEARRNLAQAGRRRAKLFTWRRSAERLLAVLDEL